MGHHKRSPAIGKGQGEPLRRRSRLRKGPVEDKKGIFGRDSRHQNQTHKGRDIEGMSGRRQGPQGHQHRKQDSPKKEKGGDRPARQGIDHPDGEEGRPQKGQGKLPEALLLPEGVPAQVDPDGRGERETGQIPVETPCDRSEIRSGDPALDGDDRGKIRIVLLGDEGLSSDAGQTGKGNQSGGSLHRESPDLFQGPEGPGGLEDPQGARNPPFHHKARIHPPESGPEVFDDLVRIHMVCGGHLASDHDAVGRGHRAGGSGHIHHPGNTRKELLHCRNRLFHHPPVVPMDPEHHRSLGPHEIIEAVLENLGEVHLQLRLPRPDKGAHRGDHRKDRPPAMVVETDDDVPLGGFGDVKAHLRPQAPGGRTDLRQGRKKGLDAGKGPGAVLDRGSRRRMDIDEEGPLVHARHEVRREAIPKPEGQNQNQKEGKKGGPARGADPPEDPPKKRRQAPGSPIGLSGRAQKEGGGQKEVDDQRDRQQKEKRQGQGPKEGTGQPSQIEQGQENDNGRQRGEEKGTHESPKTVGPLQHHHKIVNDQACPRGNSPEGQQIDRLVEEGEGPQGQHDDHRHEGGHEKKGTGTAKKKKHHGKGGPDADQKRTGDMKDRLSDHMALVVGGPDLDPGRKKMAQDPLPIPDAPDHLEGTFPMGPIDIEQNGGTAVGRDPDQIVSRGPSPMDPGHLGKREGGLSCSRKVQVPNGLGTRQRVVDLEEGNLVVFRETSDDPDAIVGRQGSQNIAQGLPRSGQLVGVDLDMKLPGLAAHDFRLPDPWHIDEEGHEAISRQVGELGKGARAGGEGHLQDRSIRRNHPDGAGAAPGRKIRHDTPDRLVDSGQGENHGGIPAEADKKLRGAPGGAGADLPNSGNPPKGHGDRSGHPHRHLGKGKVMGRDNDGNAGIVDGGVEGHRQGEKANAGERGQKDKSQKEGASVAMEKTKKRPSSRFAVQRRLLFHVPMIVRAEAPSQSRSGHRHFFLLRHGDFPQGQRNRSSLREGSGPKGYRPTSEVCIIMPAFSSTRLGRDFLLPKTGEPPQEKGLPFMGEGSGAEISVTLLGPPAVRFGESLLTGPVLDRPLALLAYLATQRGTHSRSALAELLWPEVRRHSALANLSSVLYTLQRRMQGKIAVEATRSSLSLALPPSAFEQEPVDVTRYFLDTPPAGCERMHPPRACKNCRRRLESLRELGKKSFLSGARLSFSLPYALWAESVRDRMDRRQREIERLLSESPDGAPLSSAPSGWLRRPWERRQITVLAARLSSPGGDAELRMRQREELQKSAAPLIARTGGTRLTVPGEDLVACYGFPLAMEDCARKAVVAARKLLGLRKPTESPLKIGLHTGEALSDLMKGAPDAEGHLLREAVEAATSASTGEILATFSTMRLIERHVHSERVSLPTDPISGADPRVLYRILSEKQSPSLPPVPLAGRQKEQELLWNEWQKSRDGGLRIVWITGEAGMGKSALAADLARRVELSPEGGQVCLYPCESLYRETPWSPFIRFLRGQVGLDERLPPRERRYRLEGYLLSLNAPVATAFPLLSHILEGPGPDSGEVAHIAPDKLRQMIESLLLDLASRLLSRPSILILEDIHWADEATLSLLAKGIKSLAGKPALLLLTGREKATLEALGLPPPSASLILQGLSRRDCRTVVKRLSRKPLPPEAVREAIDRSDGVPLFLREILYSDSMFRGRKGEVPPTLRDLLASRIDALGDERQMLAVAACLGQTLDGNLLIAATGGPERPQEGPHPSQIWLRTLLQKGLLEEDRPPPDSSYVFHHALMREVMLASLAASARKAIHQRIASTMVEQFPERAVQSPEILAEHLLEAGQAMEAAEQFILAGIRTASFGTYPEAICHFERARALLDAQHSPRATARRLQLLLLMGPVVKAARGYGSEAMEEIYRQADLLCESLPPGDATLPVLLGATAATLARHGPQAAGKRLPLLLEHARMSQDTAIRIRGEAFSGYLSFWRGEIQGALSELESIDAMISRSEKERLQPSWRFFEDPALAVPAKLCLLKLLSGNPDAAETLSTTLETALENVPAPGSRGYPQTFLTLFNVFLGSREKVGRKASLSLAIAEKYGFVQWETLSSMARVWAEPGPGRAEMALALERQIRGILPGIFPVYSILAAEVLLEEGWANEARGLAHSARETATHSGLGLAIPELLRLEGEGLLKGTKEERGRAEELFERSLSVAKSTGAWWFALRTALSFARHSPGEASHTSLRLSLERIRGGESFPMVQEARTLLASPRTPTI